MNDITRRGWLVIGICVLNLVVFVTWGFSGKNLACDWRNGPTTCSVEAGP